MLRPLASTLLAASLIGTLSHAQEAPPMQGVVPAPAPPNVAPGSDDHDAAIRQLIGVLGVSVNGGKLIDQLFEAYRRAFPQIPPAVWDEVRTQLATEEFADLQVAVYKKHFSLDEIKGLLQFFQSPVGQRYVQEMPALLIDGLAMGQEFSRRTTERLRRCLQQKGYSVS